MYYTWLRSFHIVAHESEFMKGTNAIGVGQPTVTAQVQSLKSAFDVELFHRDEKPTQLTYRGETLYGFARFWIDWCPRGTKNATLTSSSVHGAAMD
jgi:DNA-binding transcriptional LysR family regulator